MPQSANAQPLPPTGPHVAEVASQPSVKTLDLRAADLASESTSLGQPADGSLKGGVALPVRGPGYLFNPKRSTQARFGTTETVQTLLRAAAELLQSPDRGQLEPPLVINDLSLPQGGPIPHHGSHQSGRDVDILFFVKNKATGEQRQAVGVPLAPDGTGTDFRDLSDPSDDVPVRFDAARTWRFVAALLHHGGDDVQRIFIVEHLRSLLLREARSSGAPRALIQRFSQLSCQPGAPHDDHMHVRFYCSVQDMAEGCRDTKPTYAFRRRALAAAGLSPQLAGPIPRVKRRAAQRRTTTPAQAKSQAGPMHRKVLDFLKQRESWLKKTSPARRYCR